MKKIIVEAEESIRIDKYLSENSEYSRSYIEKLIASDYVLLNNKKIKASTKVKTGDVISIVQEIDNNLDILPEAIAINVVYEDDDVIVIDKPSGMVVHPGAGNHSKTLVNALLYYTNSLSDCNGDVRPGIVHRIDKDTSGLMIVAKNNKAHEILAQDFAHKKVIRKYLALVCGVLKHNHITIDAPIGRDTHNRKKMMVREDNSKHAVTHVEVLKRYNDYTLVECYLETGRTHQIRVHLSYIGYPIYNDPVYNPRKSTEFGQFLHSYDLTFESPLTKKKLHFTSKLPQEFQSFLDQVEQDT